MPMKGNSGAVGNNRKSNEDSASTAKGPSQASPEPGNSAPATTAMQYKEYNRKGAGTDGASK